MYFVCIWTYKTCLKMGGLYLLLDICCCFLILSTILVWFFLHTSVFNGALPLEFSVDLEGVLFLHNKIPYARHYNPRFVYFYPLFKVQKCFFKVFFLKILALCMVSFQERFLIKSGSWGCGYGNHLLQIVKTCFNKISDNTDLFCNDEISILVLITEIPSNYDIRIKFYFNEIKKQNNKKYEQYQ